MLANGTQVCFEKGSCWLVPAIGKYLVKVLLVQPPGIVCCPSKAGLPGNQTCFLFSRNSLHKSNSEDSAVGQYHVSWLIYFK